VVLAIILAGYLLVLIDVSILMAALPSIRADLGFSDTSLSWAQNAYTLTFGGLLLLGARAGDLLGRRRAFMLGIGVFTAASLAVGLAQSPAGMIAARAVQGIGAATLAPSTLALLSTSFPEGEQRSRAMAAYGALAGIGTAAGLIIGGVLTEALSWRYGFWLNVPIGLAAIVAAPRYLHETLRHAGRLDVRGALSSTFGAAALVFGIVHSADAGWGAPTTIVALALGALLLAGFVTGQARSAQPLMPLRLFADRARAGAYAARFLFNGVLVSFYFFMTQYLQGVSDYTPLEAGLAFLPVTAAAFVAATVTSRLSRRLGNESLAVAGVAAMLVGTAWTSRAGTDTAYVVGIALPMVVFGIGQGLGLSALTTGGMAGIAAKDAGVGRRTGQRGSSPRRRPRAGHPRHRLRRSRRRGRRTARALGPSRLGRVDRRHRLPRAGATGDPDGSPAPHRYAKRSRLSARTRPRRDRRRHARAHGRLIADS
jgi:EmrB/QacA subfamily drug resistance transporter